MSDPFDTDPQGETGDSGPLPFVAPCRSLEIDAPRRWISRGMEDFRKSRAKSLGYGVVAMILCYLAAYAGFAISGPLVLLTILSGLTLIGPVMAIGLYSISWQLQNGQSPRFGYCVRSGTQNLGNLGLFTSALVVLFLLWIHVGHLLHLFFPAGGLTSDKTDLVFFFGIGSAIGAVFALITFCISAFSLPMIMDRKTDLVTAIVTSINAVLRNRRVMLHWGLIISGGIFVSVITGLLALMVIFPIIGHASWHAYRETIDASAWPKRA